MKKLLLSLLGALVALPAMAYDFRYTYEGQTVEYTVIDESAKTCMTKQGYDSGSVYHHISGDLILPEHPCDGDTEYTLVEIGDYSFYGFINLTSVVIPNTVTKIDDFAFYIRYNYRESSELASITIPNSVTEIGQQAFDGCTALTSISIPESVKTIGKWAFNACTGLTKAEFTSIEHLCKINFLTTDSNPLYYAHHLYIAGKEVTTCTIPNSTTELVNTFAGWTELKSITIPNSVTKIGDGAFVGCTGLSAITIPSSVTEIGSAFSGCTGLSTITIPNSVITIGSSAFSGCTGLSAITIPNSVTTIGSSAFSGCTGLSTITIPNSVTAILSDAFSDCTGLSTITIPNSVTTIGSSAFSGCTGLSTITIPNSVTTIGGSAFSDCTGLMIVNIPAIPNWIAIDKGRNMFPENVSLYANGEKVDFKSIFTGDYVIPASVTKIGSRTFEDCTGLTSVTFPETLTTIGQSAFEGCTGLTSVTFPASIENIGDAFYGCTNLKQYNFIVSDIAKWIEADKPYMRYEAEAYINGKPLKEIFTGDFKVPDTTTKIGRYTFYGCSGLNSVEIPNSVSEIGGEAFTFCSSLTSVNLPDGMSQINSSTFAGCSSLTSVRIPKAVNEIGGWAFCDCSSLTSIEVPNLVKNIGDAAFMNCSNLENVTIGGSVTKIGLQAFDNCVAIKHLTLADGDGTLELSRGSYLGERNGQPWNVPCGLFKAAANLETLYVGRDLKFPYDYTPFEELYNLKSVIFGDKVTKIKERTFWDLDGLETFVIGKSVEEIEEHAFWIYGQMDTITIKAVVPPTYLYPVWSLFDDDVCENAVLYVPQQSVEAYKSTEPWRFFQHIAGYEEDPDEGSIKAVNIDSENETKVVYDLRGVRVGKSTEGLPHGVYIVKSAGKTTKVAI